MEIDLKKIHFVGIGGIGVSAVARMMHQDGKIVSGSDTSQSPITEKLASFGITIFPKHAAKNVPTDADLVIYTIAVPDTNPELVEARLKNIPTVTYPQMLAVISKNMTTIAVSGTHGKTTTTAMLAKIFGDAELDPTVIVGSLMKDSESNLRVGHSDYFIVEACEYRRSFLNLYPTILVITNIDEDHLDYYKDIADIQSAFREIVLRVPKHGAIICNVSDPRLAPVLEGLECTIIDYTKIEKNFELQIPGKHNRQNAGAAYAVADFLKIDIEKIISSLENFTGTWRRFDLQGKTKNGATVYDDYAHHPQEIRATLQGMREMFPDKKRVVFFQPHLFSRTKSLLNEFATAFGDVDEVHILPIYPARESFDPSITSEMLVEKIHNTSSHYIPTFIEAEEKIQTYGSDTVLITMGAGDIYKINKGVIV
jgi:UDP-N-acetylmuramate--alanine ligase